MDKLTLESTQVRYACEAAVQAGKLIAPLQNSQIRISHKKDGSPLTDVDVAANTIICDLLANTKIPIISEELEIPHWELRSGWKTFWIVDPLDGTAEYLRKSKDYSILIGLIYKGIPQLGVVCTPAWDQLYVGIPGGTMWVSSMKDFVGVSSLREFVAIRSSTIVTMDVFLQSATQQSLEDRIFQRCLERKYPHVVIKKRAGIFKILDLICGTAQGYTRFSPSWMWDIAAGHALLQSVGMDLVDLQQGTIRYDKENLQIEGLSYWNPAMIP